MCPVRPFLRARGWLAGGEPHDRPREAGRRQEPRCGSTRAGASRPHPRLLSGALGSLAPLLPSPVAARGADHTQPRFGTTFLGDARGWGGPSLRLHHADEHVEGDAMSVAVATELGLEPV